MQDGKMFPIGGPGEIQNRIGLKVGNAFGGRAVQRQNPDIPNTVIFATRASAWPSCVKRKFWRGCGPGKLKFAFIFGSTSRNRAVQGRTPGRGSAAGCVP